MAKEILIPQQSFTGEEDAIPNVYRFVLENVFNNEKINVLFDGIKYECDRFDYQEENENYLCKYGASFSPQIRTIDFSEYPFSFHVDSHDNETVVLVQDDNEHTIEVYVGEEEKLPITEFLEASTQVESKYKAYKMFFESYYDDDVMGTYAYIYDANGNKFLFKDKDLKKPVMEHELLAMFLHHTYPIAISNDNMILSRMEDFGNELNTYEYKEGKVKKQFISVGSYYAGETFVDFMGYAPGDKKQEDEEEPQEEVVLIPETTFTTNEQGGYNFVGVEAFKYSQIKIILNGEEKIVDGTKPGETYVYVFSGSVPNVIGIATGTVMSKPVVSFFDSINQEPTTYTIKVVKITDEEIPEEPQEDVLIPETTFNTSDMLGSFGYYTFDGITPFRYTQVKIIFDGEEIIADGIVEIGMVHYDISEDKELGCNETQNTVRYAENASSSTTHTIKVIKITDEEIEDDDEPTPVG